MEATTVLVSSTRHDLVDVRAELSTMLSESGLTPMLFEDATTGFDIAADRVTLETCLANVRRADVVLCVLGDVYGTEIEHDGHVRSFTHHEYRTAIDGGKRTFLFVRDRTLGLFRTAMARGDSTGLHEGLKRQLTEAHEERRWIQPFTSSVDLKRQVAAQLHGVDPAHYVQRVMAGPFFAHPVPVWAGVSGGRVVTLDWQLVGSHSISQVTASDGSDPEGTNPIGTMSPTSTHNRTNYVVSDSIDPVPLFVRYSLVDGHRLEDEYRPVHAGGQPVALNLTTRRVIRTGTVKFEVRGA